MTNHPNRNWRRVMNDAANAYLSRYRWPDEGAQVMTIDQLRNLLHSAFVAGYSTAKTQYIQRKP